jgi:NTE family protein
MRFSRLFKKETPKKFKVGLAFGGGGTKGFAHIGAIKAFEENGITFDEVSGTSVGSIAATFYAFGLTSQEMMQKAKSIKVSDIRNSKLFFVPSKTDGLENFVKNSIGDAYFEDMKKPLTIVAVDLKSAKEVHLTKGNVAKAVAGSCAVPGIFNPVDFGEYRLADGGLQNTIPADVLRNNGCRYVISIDCNSTRGQGTDSTKLVDILFASIRIMMKSNAIKGKVYSDICIDIDTGKYKSTSLEGADEMYQMGYEATLKAIPKIKELLGQKQKFNFFGMFKKNKKRELKKQKKQAIND